MKNALVFGRVLAAISFSSVAGAACAQGALGDVTIGGDARSFAMGGAGVASLVGQRSLGGVRTNPASLAFAPGPFGVQWPNVGLRADGPVSLGRGVEYLLGPGGVGDAASLARRFASGDSVFGLNASVGVRVGALEIQAGAVGVGRLLPNASLQAWARSGSLGPVPGDARADLLAAGVVTLPSVGYALRLPKSLAPGFDLSVGGRLKWMQAYYTHAVAGAGAIGGGDAFLAPEMGGRETLSRRGVGADLGVIARSRAIKGLSAGLVVANAIRPSFAFDGTDATGAARRYDLLGTTVSTGVGYERGSTTLAADLVDATGAVGPAQLRLGGEQRLGSVLSLRGGYSTATSWTWGFGAFGYDVAFGKRQPLEIVRTIRF